MADENQPRQLQPVEILHIDTAGSQAFFDKFEVNASEKCDCQKILFDLFSECCQQHGGYVASNWQGDGGHAFSLRLQQIGRAIQAAKISSQNIPSSRSRRLPFSKAGPRRIPLAVDFELSAISGWSMSLLIPGLMLGSRRISMHF